MTLLRTVKAHQEIRISLKYRALYIKMQVSIPAIIGTYNKSRGIKRIIWHCLRQVVSVVIYYV